MSLGPGEIILILLILLLLFGAKRLPELAKGLGKSLKEFKKATSDIQKEIEDAGDMSKPFNPSNHIKTDSKENKKTQEKKSDDA